MKRFVSLVIGILLLGVFSTAAYAQAYTDDENRMTVQIPDGASVYYYTPEDTNMFEDLLEQVQSSGRDVRLLIRSYTPDYLGWSMEVTASPLDGEPEAAQDPQDEEDSVVAPSSLPSGTASTEFTDITRTPEEEQERDVELVRSAYQGRFNFSDPIQSTLNGVPALEMDGTGVEDSIWGPYDTSVYLVTNTNRLLTISLVYQRSDAHTFENAAKDALSTIVLGDAPAPTPTATTAPTESPSPSPSPTVSASVTATVTTAVSAKDFFQDFWSNIQKKFAELPNLVYYIMIAVAVVLLIVALVIHLRNARKRKAWMMEDDDDWSQVHAGIQTELREGRTTQDSPNNPRKIRRIEDSNMISEQSSQHLKKGYDFTEDISRYTQQPGPEVNDVSRFTHGYDDEVDDELKKLQDQSFVEPQPVKVQSVGSRVERRRRRRGK